MDLNIAISSINFVVIIVFSLFVFIRDVKNKVNRSFLLLGFIIAFWILTNLLADLSRNISAALFWSRLAILGPAFLSMVFFYLVTELFNYKKFHKILFTIFSLISVVMSLFVFTTYNIQKVHLSSIGTEYVPGSLYYFLFIYLLIGFGYIFYILISIYKTSLDPIKSQSRLILIGSFSSVFLGVISNIILPILGFSIASILGPPFVLFFIFFTALAILRYRLLDFKVIVAELSIVAIWIILLVKVLFDYPYNFLFNSVIFVSVLFFGILFVKGILKEVKQREQIEKMAEATQKAYEIEKKAKEELENLDKTKNQFLLTIQHHLRTPLTSMMGYADLLVNGAFGKQPKKTLEIIRKFQTSTESLIKMVNEFLDITQFQLGKDVIVLKPGIELGPILDEIVGELKFEAESKGIYLKFEKPLSAQDKPEKLHTVKADKEKLRAALSNIFDNAIKYTPKCGVSVKVENGDNKVTIICSDTGIGITQEKLQNLFNRTFERGEQAKKTFATGSGLGLFLSNKIILGHDGKLWAESPGENQGSTFYIE